MAKQSNTEQFIEKAKLKHGDRYDYSLVDYVKSNVKVKIICPEHGEFLQTPNHHLYGKNCSKCSFKKNGQLCSLKIKDKKQDFSHITPPEGARIIPLTQGRYALVDEEYYERVIQHNWCCDSYFYAHNGTLGKLHRFIMNVTDPNIHVDHKYHNVLDNRKQNLRICNNTQNRRNMKPKSSGTSKYKGVSWYKNYQNWESAITCSPKRYKIGYFATEEEAARAYDAKAKELFGEFAYLNFKD